MITAMEARALSKKNKVKDDEKTLSYIEANIQKAAKEGRSMVSRVNVSVAIITTLRDRGFTVKEWADTYDGTTGINISW